MANNLAVLPWYIDTTSSSVLYNSKIKINQIEYVGYTTSGHSIEVQDQNGKTIAFLIGTATPFPTVSTWEEVGWVDGLKVPTAQSAKFGGGTNLQSGVILIYIR